jgi:rfaE bifunctional protein kinase chain/domain
MSNLQRTIGEHFAGKTVLVVGDLVADQFLQGTITRVSREAPVFIMRHDRTQTLPGAAANCAINVASLGGMAVLIGAAGADDNGAALLDKLREGNVACDHIVTSPDIRTTTKVRVLAGQEHAAKQQVIRIDYENAPPLSSDLSARLVANITMAAAAADAIVISDYNYGAASREVSAAVYAAAAERGIPVLVDSRFNLTDFSNAASATPNQDEVENIAGRRLSDVAELETFCSELRERLGYRSLMVTRGGNGILLVEKGLPALHLDAVGSKEPVDVTGAGDTVIAAYALGLASGLSFADAARVANHAGGIVVMKRGTASVSATELIDSINSQPQTISANS